MIMNDKIKDIIETELYNFIDFFTSDDKEREDMKSVADNYIKEEFENTPDRINILEEKAWMNITGQEIIETLNEKEAEEYEKLLGDEK